MKKRMVKILIWPVVLYGCETWTLLEEEIDRLQALEMWLWRGIEKISWRDRVSNQDVLIKVDERRCLMRTIWQRKKNWIGHVLRGNGLLKDVLEGRMLDIWGFWKEKKRQTKSERKRRGRPRAKMIDDLMEKPKPKEMRREMLHANQTIQNRNQLL